MSPNTFSYYTHQSYVVARDSHLKRYSKQTSYLFPNQNNSGQHNLSQISIGQALVVGVPAPHVWSPQQICRYHQPSHPSLAWQPSSFSDRARLHQWAGTANSAHLCKTNIHQSSHRLNNVNPCVYGNTAWYTQMLRPPVLPTDCSSRTSAN